MRKVLIISYYWPPSGGAGVQRWLKFTKYLPEFGWQPIVLTVNPDDATYPAMDPAMEKEVPEGVKVIKTHSRNIFKRYERLFKNQQVASNGFSNMDTDSFPQKMARFLRGNFFIPDPRKGWNRYAYLAAKKILSEEEGIEAIITSSPPHSTQLIGMKLQKAFNIPWIADLRDPWTDIYYYHLLYLTPPARWINLRFEKKVFQNARQIITVSPTLRDHFLRKHALPPEKVNVVYNGFDEADFDNHPVEKDPTFTITYVGRFFYAYPVENLVEAFLELLKTGQDMKLRFVGEASGAQSKSLQKIPEEQIEFISYASHLNAIAYMKQTHVLLLVIPDHITGKAILPGKLFEYLASGTPILGIGPVDGDSAAILKQTGKGKMLDFDDARGIRDELFSLYSGHKKSLQGSGNRSHESYSRRNLTAELVRIMDQLSTEA